MKYIALMAAVNLIDGKLICYKVGEEFKCLDMSDSAYTDNDIDFAEIAEEFSMLVDVMAEFEEYA